MAAQSKKLYIALADKYAEKKPQPDWGPDTLAMWHVMVVGTATVLKEGNSAFDRAKFLAACGVDSNVITALSV